MSAVWYYKLATLADIIVLEWWEFTVINTSIINLCITRSYTSKLMLLQWTNWEGHDSGACDRKGISFKTGVEVTTWITRGSENIIKINKLGV